MRISETSDLWWKSAVVYCLDVATFLDWDGDGTGDFTGLTERIDYLAELGVTCLWLMPFYPTTDHDDGYDITDYYGVDSRLGTHGDLVEAVHTAQDRGMRVIVDLVVNHTSDQHPWFIESRSSTESPYRDYYVWRSDEPPDTSDKVAFPDAEDSIWRYDERTGEYYLHKYYRHQPDLNIANEAVRDEIAKVLGFWVEVGVSGFRVDAVPELLSLEGLEDAVGGAAPDPHDYFRALAGFLRRRRGDAILLGEVNLPHEDQLRFVGDDGDQLTMVFDFPVMQRTVLALARQDARPLAETLAARPALPSHCQWATFLRNHDELTLDQLSDAERQDVFAAFGPKEEHQIFGRGLRRRLAPMLGGDQRRLRMAYSLLFALPGTPVLFYGEEIGMGENLDLDGRLAVRSPMQWMDAPHGGFTTPEQAPVRKVTSGDYGPDRVNAVQQRTAADSLFRFLEQLIRTYRHCPELGWAEADLLDQPAPQVLAHQCRVDDRWIVALHNLSDQPQPVEARLPGASGARLVHLLGDLTFDLDEDGRLAGDLEPYGFRWLRVVPEGGARLL